MMTKLLLLLLPLYTCAQNLVPDPGFEKKLACPDGFTMKGNMPLTEYWTIPTDGTSDYFHKCGKGLFAAPATFFGNVEPKEGDAFAGMVLYLAVDPPYTEYLQTRLIAPLSEDSMYCIKFYYRPGAFCQYRPGSVSCTVTKEAIGSPERVRLAPEQVFENEIPAGVDMGGWSCFHYRYRAKGGEQYLTIGTFTGSVKFGVETNTHPEANRNIGSSYCFVDEVSVSRKRICNCFDYTFSPGK